MGYYVQKKVCKNKKWNAWANKWLNGKDRSKEAAYAAAAANAANAQNINLYNIAKKAMKY